MRPLVLIPARMASLRLPNKPLADIAGEPMIVRVWRRAVEADVGPVVVATEDERIAGVVRDAGGEAVMTRADHPSGSDRIHEAMTLVDPGGHHDAILNCQGDLPLIEPGALKACIALLEDRQVAIGTLAAKIMEAHERDDPNVVKVVATPLSDRHLRALYFTRATAPYGDGPLLHHVGLYAYRRDALVRFVSLAPSTLEKRERLEQLRALEDGMRIDVGLVDKVPIGVDSPADLERARQFASGGRQ